MFIFIRGNTQNFFILFFSVMPDFNRVKKVGHTNLSGKIHLLPQKLPWRYIL